MQEKHLGELILARIHAGPVFALARRQENSFEEVFPEYLAKFSGEFTRCEYRKIFLANYLCIGFLPGVILRKVHDSVFESGLGKTNEQEDA